MAQPRPLPADHAPRVPRRTGRLVRLRPRFPVPGRRTGIAALIVLGLIALLVIASFFVDEPLRRQIESRMNDRLKGYTARIERLSFHPLGFSLTLYGLSFSQNAHPDPAIFHVERLDASVQWKALLHRKVVADFEFIHPKLYLDIQHIREEVKDPTPVTQHGWQEAFEEIYPLKINEVIVRDGEAVYVDLGPFKPLRLSDIQVRADNIRNIRSKARDYPSELELTAVVFEKGRLEIQGHADFLAEPHVGIKANVELAGIPLDYFKPVTNQYNLTVSGGELSADGLIEYAPTIKVADLRNAEIKGVKIDYIHTPKNVGVAQKATKATADVTKQTANRSDLLVRVEHVRVRQSELGITNKMADPPFRVFLTDVSLDVENVTNQRSEGIGKIHLTGKFMGSGRTEANLSFEPDEKGPDFHLTVKLEDTDMTTMNPLLRQYGKFDVVQGKFSFYTELDGKKGQVTGYVKPLFKDVKAYDPTQDQDKSFTKKLYEKLVGGVSKILKNFPRKEVATKVDVEGRLDQPQTSVLQAIGNLIRNAFIKAILPGLEREPPQVAEKSKS
jgi:hypothetical protein